MEQNTHKAFIVFPVHLFKDIEVLREYDKIYLFEEPTYFTRYKFHKLKLMYHRATMKCYYDYLVSNQLDVSYIEYKVDLSELVQEIRGANEAVTLGYYDPVDHALSANITSISEEGCPELEMYENKQFTCTNFDLNNYMADSHHDTNQHKKYHHDGSFYKWQRRRLNILMGKNGADPQRWSYDTENRKPFRPSSKMKVPILPTVFDSKYINEAREYIEANFKDNYGSTGYFIYPLDSIEAETWLDRFFEIKFDNYGPYQDAVHSDYPFMFHSILSPMLNIGLLTAPLIVEKTLEYYKQHPKLPIQSIEGFLRQIIGWREYVRLIYVMEGEKQRKCNFFNHSNRLNKNWYGKGGLGIHCIDDLIKKVDKYAYLHHIERLMYAGNFMLLCGIHPDDAFKWFMEYFIDSYDWVMVPNTYGMTQHADGGLMMTRPYFSSSNYILRMSSYQKGPSLIVNKKQYDWSDVFDALYYNFISQHQETLKKYYATRRNVGHWEHKTEKEQQKLRDLGESYIREYIQSK